MKNIKLNNFYYLRIFMTCNLNIALKYVLQIVDTEIRPC